MLGTAAVDPVDMVRHYIQEELEKKHRGWIAEPLSPYLHHTSSTLRLWHSSKSMQHLHNAWVMLAALTPPRLHTPVGDLRQDD